MPEVQAVTVERGTRCLLCGHVGAFAVVNRIARNATPQVSVACSRCGFVQVDPMPDAETLSAYYASGQYRREFPPLLSEAEEDAKAEQAARFIATQLSGPLLEIGCGYGRVASLLRADATEADPDMRAEAESRGVNVDGDSIEDEDRVVERVVSGGGYGGIYAMQVLEHCADPLETLREWRSWLAPGGKIHLQVPTLEAMYGGSSYWFQWPHVTSWTQRTLTFALIMSGFERVTVGIDGTVLWATAFRSESPAPTYEALAAAVSWPVDDPAALIAKHDAAVHAATPRARYENGEDVGGAVLNDFVRGGSLLTVLGPHDADIMAAEDALREEVRRLASTFDLARESVAKMAADLGELAKREGDAYEGDPWLYGYRQGKAREAAAVQSVLTALANHLVVRATGGKS